MSTPQLYDHRGNAIALRDVQALERKLSSQSESMYEMKERLAELELSMEDQGWRQIVEGGNREFSRAALSQIMHMSRMMYLKNPLIKRGVNIQATYVWGRGVTIRGREPLINKIVQQFLDNPKNKAELTSHEARTLKEVDLQVLGNIFFVFFVDAIDTGNTTIRTLPTDEILSIIHNPEDSKDPWFYKRDWNEYTYTELDGAQNVNRRTAYYPSWSHNPTDKPKKMYGQDVMWENPIYHVKVGALSDMQFGVPETYAAIDWAKAYKDFLEDWCSITKAYARFAWEMKTKGGARGVNNANTQLATTLANDPFATERNPPANVASTFIHTDVTDMKPFKTAGATTSADDGRRVLLMVCAALGLPEHFLGDGDNGNRATSKSMDRPTELKFKDRQSLWAEIFGRILDFVLDRSAAATNSPLAGKALVNKSSSDEDETDEVIPLVSDPQSGEEIDRYVEISFPALLEHDVKDQVEAIVDAATLKGFALAGTIDLKTVSTLVLKELGAENVEEIVAEMFPDGEPLITGKPLPDDKRLAAAVPPDEQDPNAPNQNQPSDPAITATQTEAAFRARGMRDLRSALSKFVEKWSQKAA